MSSALNKVLNTALRPYLSCADTVAARTAILRALDAAGMMVVPKMATTTMQIFGFDVQREKGTMSEIWGAMVAAAGDGE